MLLFCNEVTSAMLYLECTAVGTCLNRSVLTYSSDIWHGYIFAVKYIELSPGHFSPINPSPSSGTEPSSVYSPHSCPYPWTVQNKAVGWCDDNDLELCLAGALVVLPEGLCCLYHSVHHLNHVHLLLNTSTQVPWEIWALTSTSCTML